MNTLFETTAVLDEAWIPKGSMTDYFPIGTGVPDKHQQEMMELLFDSDCEAIVNTNPTGSGKTLSWAGPVIRSQEFGDPWIAMATYPTKALVSDQREAILNLFRLYYTDDEYDPENGFQLESGEDGDVLTNGEREYPLEDRVVEVTADSTRGEATSEVIVDGYEDAVKAFSDGLPTIFLTTPDTLTLLAANRFTDNDVVGIPGLVNMIVVDEFHLSNPRGKRLLPFHLDVFMRLADSAYLEKLVYLSATPVPEYVQRIEQAFEAETVSRDVEWREPSGGGRKILPETRLHVTSRPMFTNGQWLAGNVETLLDFYNDNGQMVVILDSVREVEEVASELERRTALDIGRIYGWKRVGRDEAVSQSDILVGNTAVEVGVDFDDVNRLVFSAYDASSTIQRLGRMRNSTRLDDFQAAIITTPETHNRLLDVTYQNRIQRDSFETVLYDTLDDTTDRPYYDVLCGAYARYLWEDADDGWGVSSLNEMYLPSKEENYIDATYRHFSPAVETLTGDMPSKDEFWMYLNEIKENYRDGRNYPVLDEMHTYRPSSLSCVIVDADDPEEPLKNYGIHYVLRYCNGRVLEDEVEAKAVFEQVNDRKMTSDEEEFFNEASRYSCGFFVSYGTLDAARDYWIADYSMLENQRTKWGEGPHYCQPELMQNPSVRTDPPIQGTGNLDLGDESILMQFVGMDSDTARTRFSLGPYASAVPVDEMATLLLWQDGILTHSTIMSEQIQESTPSEQTTTKQETEQQTQTSLSDHT